MTFVRGNGPQQQRPFLAFIFILEIHNGSVILFKITKLVDLIWMIEHAGNEFNLHNFIAIYDWTITNFSCFDQIETIQSVTQSG